MDKDQPEEGAAPSDYSLPADNWTAPLGIYTFWRCAGLALLSIIDPGCFPSDSRQLLTSSSP